MTPARWIQQSLRHYRRSHLGVLFGAILATAILTGALCVGDSVRHSLRVAALERLGTVHSALYQPGRFFRTSLAGAVTQERGVPLTAAIQVRGAATNDAGDARVGRVQVLGMPIETGDGVALNERLARALRVQVGEEVLLRVDKPSLLSRDAPLSKIEDATVVLRLPVTRIVTTGGNFSLEANQVPPYNAFVPLATLQKALDVDGRANLLLVHGATSNAGLTATLWKRWELADSGLEVRPTTRGDALEVRTNRVFLEQPVADAALTAYPGAQGVLTYFVNRLSVAQKSTPYSSVAALNVPDLADDEAVINQWLAEDLGAKVGDTLTLAYWIVGPLRKLEEHTTTFTIKQVVPMNHPLCDPGLMPDIPGLSDKKDCREWEPGVPIDLDKIRDKDQAYWTTYKGTPKAFLSLRAGQKIWNNRFGNLTAVRYAASVGNTATVTACLRQALSPASQGVFFQPVRENALAAVAQSLDFGLLFLGFSLFLIVAALLLCALLFAFGIEQRREEMGILLALGIPARRVRQWFLWEGGAVALVASVIGVLLATLYTRAVVQGLSGVWQDAVVSTPLRYYASPLTLAIGGLVSFLMALATIAFVTRRQAQSSARELLTLTESVMPSVTERKRLPGAMTAIGAGVFAALLLAGTGQAHGETVLGLFFGAGMCLLTAGLSAARMLLAILERGTTLPLSPPQLALRNAVRRAGRSVGAMALLACGSFLVIAVGANRHDPNEEAYDQRSGTGGFALYGEASLPLYDAESLRGKNFVAFRLREGDEASCLNLNRAQTPRLLGVNPAQLQKRFTFSQPMTGGDWSLLTKPVGDAIPVIGDSNTVMWALGKKVGDVISYKDEHGVAQKLQIVGVIGNSVLQGGLILSEANFLRLFPSASGYQVFLFDAEKTAAVMLAQELTQDLEDNGMSITPTGERLAAFNTVENVYLSIFAVLGGLGLILGSVGLGVLLLRNVYERRSELALLRAVGYSTGALQALLFREHALLLVSGLGIGAVSGLVAVLPSLRSPGAQVPYLSLTLTLLLVFLSGFVWTWLASVVALRRPLLAALRAE